MKPIFYIIPSSCNYNSSLMSHFDSCENQSTLGLHSFIDANWCLNMWKQFQTANIDRCVHQRNLERQIQSCAVSSFCYILLENDNAKNTRLLKFYLNWYQFPLKDKLVFLFSVTEIKYEIDQFLAAIRHFPFISLSEKLLLLQQNSTMCTVLIQDEKLMVALFWCKMRGVMEGEWRLGRKPANWFEVSLEKVQ